MVTLHFLKKFKATFAGVQSQGKRSCELRNGSELKEVARSSSAPLHRSKSNQETTTNCFIRIKLLHLHTNYFAIAV